MADQDKILSDVNPGQTIASAHINALIDAALNALPKGCALAASRTFASGLGIQTLYTGFTPRNIRLQGSKDPAGGTQSWAIGNVIVEAIELFKYANDAAVQAVWDESGDATLITQLSSGGVLGEGYVNVAYTDSTHTATVTADDLQQYDLRRLTGVDSGVPTRGTIVLPFKKSATNCTGATIRLGNDASNYFSIPVTFINTNGVWLIGRALLTSGTQTGTVNWQNIDYVRIALAITGSGSIDLDSLILVNENNIGGDGAATNTQSGDTACYQQVVGDHVAKFAALGEKNVGIEWTSFTGNHTEKFYLTATN